MRTISFKVFKDKILKGIKNQTIRKRYVRPIKKGEPLRLYWKQRSKNNQILGDTTCSDTFEIVIHRENQVYDERKLKYLTRQEIKELANYDGFAKIEDFFAFFEKEYTLPFPGTVIRWYPLEEKREKKAALLYKPIPKQ